MWTIERIVSKGDYNYAVVRNHPKRINHDYVLEHRVVVENYLGRILCDDEVVHHINENKKDNNIDNLKVMSVEEHARFHALKQGLSLVKLKCPCCGLLFNREKRQTHLIKSSKWTACSKTCRGIFSRYIQLNGFDQLTLDKIMQNVIEEYKRFTAT